MLLRRYSRDYGYMLDRESIRAMLDYASNKRYAGIIDRQQLPHMPLSASTFDFQFR